MSGCRSIRKGSETVRGIRDKRGGVVVLDAGVLGVNIENTKADASISKVLTDCDLDCGEAFIWKKVSPCDHGKDVHSRG